MRVLERKWKKCVCERESLCECVCMHAFLCLLVVKKCVCWRVCERERKFVCEREKDRERERKKVCMRE